MNLTAVNDIQRVKLRSGERRRVEHRACVYHSCLWYELTGDGFKTGEVQDWPGGITIAEMYRSTIIGAAP